MVTRWGSSNGNTLFQLRRKLVSNVLITRARAHTLGGGAVPSSSCMQVIAGSLLSPTGTAIVHALMSKYSRSMPILI
jgi:hypothetical protein